MIDCYCYYNLPLNVNVFIDLIFHCRMAKPPGTNMQRSSMKCSSQLKSDWIFAATEWRWLWRVDDDDGDNDYFKPRLQLHRRLSEAQENKQYYWQQPDRR